MQRPLSPRAGSPGWYLQDRPPRNDKRPVRSRLLFHNHDDELWNQKIFLLRGRLEEADGHVFRPEKFIPSIGTGGPLGTVRMVLGVRKAAAAYLKRRGMARPRIPWDEVEALKEGS